MAKKTNSSTAVLARRRAKDDNEGLTPEQQLWKTLDFFSTPPWGARAGAEILRDVIGASPDHLFYEPAAGQGHIYGPLGEVFPFVEASDVHDHGMGFGVRDWLSDDWDLPECDWIVTNPPFGIADRFVTLGLERADKGVALLLRTAFVESAERYPLFEGKHPLTLMAPFSERLPMTLGRWDPTASSATSYSWFFWVKGRDPMPPKWIGPGTRDRLWKPDDPAKYGVLHPMPLFPDFDVV
jgi:hypothetical protein